MQPTGNLTPGIRGEAGELRWPVGDLSGDNEAKRRFLMTPPAR